MSALRDVRVLRAAAAIDTGRELLDELRTLDVSQIRPHDIGRLEASLENSLTRLAELLHELSTPAGVL